MKICNGTRLLAPDDDNRMRGRTESLARQGVQSVVDRGARADTQQDTATVRVRVCDLNPDVVFTVRKNACNLYEPFGVTDPDPALIQRAEMIP